MQLILKENKLTLKSITFSQASCLPVESSIFTVALSLTVVTLLEVLIRPKEIKIIRAKQEAERKSLYNERFLHVTNR